MGKIKDINALPNLYLILSNKGFKNVKLTHLGDLWVLLELDTIETTEKIRVKELAPWSPNFFEEKDDSSQSDDELVGDEKENNSGNFVNYFELDNEKELDHVSETSFMHENDMVYNQASKFSEQPFKSDDPFNNTDPQFPPGFTLDVGFTPHVGKINVEEVNSSRVSQPKEDLNGRNEGVASNFSGIKGVSSIKLGGSLLDVMHE
ncbi:hypothetical protein Tco_0697623, partial [Tanacetum coccineum]